MGIITAVFAGISTALSWLWVKFCMLFLMWSMRQNEYLADEFAYKIGFGLELATVLDQHISDVPHDGFLSAIYSTHPCNDDRVAALQNLGVPYSGLSGIISYSSRILAICAWRLPAHRCFSLCCPAPRKYSQSIRRRSNS